jgi:hypothetical protein
MDVISNTEGDTRTYLRGMLGSVSCTRPGFPVLGKPEVWYKSRYPPLRMLAPERRVRGSSAIGSRRLVEVGRREFVH